MNIERFGDSTDRFDAVVVGGGPAGLSAALLLGRSRRRVLVATDGAPRNAVARAAYNVFLHPSAAPRCDLPFRLGCAMTSEGRVDADERGKTSVPGVYVAGDAGANPELVICAAASGTMAAGALNDDLLEQDFGG